jgi:non-specific protein-tyrosine kinase
MEAAAELDQQVELERLNLTLSTQRATYSNLLSNYEELRIAEASQASMLIVAEGAVPSYVPVRPRVLNNTVLAALVGAMLASAVVFVAEYLDDSVKTPNDIASLLGSATLGTIGQIGNGAGQKKLVALSEPRSPLSEAFRALRTNIHFAGVAESLSAILVTSSGPGEGKSTTSANLALVLAQAGKQVILVDADLRRPTLHRFFDLPNGQGLTTALLDLRSPIDAHLQETEVTGLKVMSSGPIPPNPAELLSSQRQSDLLQELQRQSDIVLIDSPPVLTVADALVLAPQTNGVLLVVEAGRTRKEVLKKAGEALERTDARLLGVVLNQMTARRSGYYYQYYQHYYSEYEQDRPGRTKQRKLRSRI